MNKAIEDLQELSPNEKGFVAQYLISSLDTTQDTEAQAEWSELAKKRFELLENGDVQPISWESTKNQVLL
ncbi:MAG: addiction module protein [Sulfuricurvum sp.]|uniref:addiction module protein n=1 Tax=Sulfuricurvum sp. TaxID=2025608 RepID=UPI0025F2450C|nr:addiction module protein [Sulfuricurvum sp.]MCK9372790.1 addiction module protein [Sulfuricurvum sp.]